MQLFGLILALAGLVLVVAVLVAPVVLLFHTRRIRTLEARIAAVEAALARRIAAPKNAPAGLASPEVEPEAGPAAQPEAPPAPPAESAPPPESIPEPLHGPAPGPIPRPRRSSGLRGLEEAFTARWMVWLGGLAIALSAVFLFRFAVEQGWLGPATRVGLGLLLGVALVLAGGWLHHRPPVAPTFPSGLAGRLPPD